LREQSDKTIFISYTREDSEAANRLYNDLKVAGLDPWLDTQSLLGGQNWKIAIKEAIKNSRYFIPLLSSNSVEKVGYVQKELKEALEVLDEFPKSKIFVIPVRINECNVNDEKLKELHIVDLFPDWESGVKQILKSMDTAVAAPQVSVEHGDITAFDADVVALKYAQNFYGVDLEIAEALSKQGIPIDEMRPAQRDYRFMQSRFSIKAPYVLFVGVPPLEKLDYREIRDFSRKVLKVLADEAPETKHLAMTIHGPGFGLDETESFLAQFAGFIDAFRNNQLPLRLRHISIVDHNAKRVEKLRQILDSNIDNVSNVSRVASSLNNTNTIKPDDSKLALVIGIDVYRSEGLIDLPFCRKDAKDLTKVLRALGYTIFQDEPIIGSRLNKENSWVDIHRAIVNFFYVARPAQTLLFYFSGYGIARDGDVYLALPEINTQDPIVEGFSLMRLTRLMTSSKSMRIVSIIDACYSGTAVLPAPAKAKVAREAAGRALTDYHSILDSNPKTEGRCFLLSSQPYEPTLAAEDSYSLYTKYLIEGLRGAKPGIDEKGLRYPGSVDGDGNVTPETLHRYLYHKVANEAEQVPMFKSDMASNIILAHHPHLAENKLDANSIVREGDEHFLRDEYDKAIECYNRAIGVNPDLIDAWYKKGNALYNKENYDEAIKCYDRVSLINPNHFDSWYKKGLAYKKENKHNEAIKCYDKALQIRANRATVNSNLWYEKGLSLSYLKRYEEAIKCYDKAIEINPKYAEAWYSKGYAYYELQNHEEAQRCYIRVKEISPEFIWGWYSSQPPSERISRRYPMPTIFISFSTADGKDIADHIHEHYIRKGYNVFYSPKAIPYGREWREEIKRNIEKCDIFLLIATWAALDSQEVRKEIDEAKQLGKRIIPCRPDDVDWSDLEKFQIDLTQGPEFDSKYELVRKIESQLRREFGGRSV
jgi:tetratricopeptide (TPR) repeat protein